MRDSGTMRDPGRDPPDDVSCTRCGSFRIEHVPRHRTHRDERTRLIKGGEVEPEWFNRCRDCGRLQEYVPSKAVIAIECEQIREARGEQAHDEAPTFVPFDPADEDLDCAA